MRRGFVGGGKQAPLQQRLLRSVTSSSRAGTGSRMLMSSTASPSGTLKNSRKSSSPWIGGSKTLFRFVTRKGSPEVGGDSDQKRGDGTQRVEQTFTSISG